MGNNFEQISIWTRKDLEKKYVKQKLKIANCVSKYDILALCEKTSPVGKG